MKTESVRIMYFSFGDRQPTHLSKDISCFLRDVLLTKIKGIRDSEEIAAAANIIAEKLQSSFQKSNRTKSEPIMAPDVSMA